MLAKLNAHPRDSRIKKVDNHYEIENHPLHPTRVTSLVHRWFPKFDADLIIDKMMKSKKWEKNKYYGKTKDEIKNEWTDSSNLGTLMHEDIERFFNDEPLLNEDTIEFNYFVHFWEEFQLINPSFRPYRTEWVIYDENKNIAGSIDCVLSDDDGNLIILDWKRSKEIKTKNPYQCGFGPFKGMDDCNYNHYRLQLNVYRSILERMYGKTVVGMFIIVLHPINEGFIMFEMKRKSLKDVWESLAKDF